MEFRDNLSAQRNSAAPWHPWSEITGDPWAVVACVDSLNGIQTVRELSRQGVRIIGLVANPDEPFGRTRLCEKVAVATTEGPELIETLLELGSQLGQKAVLFPVSDDTVGMISRHRKSLSEYFHIVLPSEDVVEMMLSKDKFYAHAVAEDLPVPRTVVVSGPSDLELAIETLTFPCIVKPERRAEIWHKFTKYKGLKIADVAELRQLYEACHKMVGTIIVQEWIVGTSADLYSCNLYLDAKSEPLATFVARKLRQWPPDVGSSSSGEECRNDAVLELALDFFQSAGVPRAGLSGSEA